MISVADLRRNAASATTDASHLLSKTSAAKKISAAAARGKPVARRVITYRHDPYSYTAITTVSTKLAEESFFESYSLTTTASPASQQVISSAGFALPLPASKVRAAQHRQSNATSKSLDMSITEDGVSEVSSENGVSNTAVARKCVAVAPHGPLPDGVHSPEEGGLSPESASAAVILGASPAPIVALPSVIRYATVNFRFGSAWFIAPFKTAVGELVVVEYPASNSLHMGIVSAVTTTKPATFYSAENPNPDTLTDDEVAILPRLLRHARDFDKETKLDLRTHDLRSLQSAKQLAEEMHVPIQFLDAEWLLDLSAITLLVNVYGSDVALVDQLADELASVEGAEVVFTYPAVKPRSY